MIFSKFIYINSNNQDDSKSVHFSFFFYIYIYWIQVIDVSPKILKDILTNKGNANNLVIFDQHLGK